MVPFRDIIPGLASGIFRRAFAFYLDRAFRATVAEPRFSAESVGPSFRCHLTAVAGFWVFPSSRFLLGRKIAVASYRATVPSRLKPCRRS